MVGSCAAADCAPMQGFAGDDQLGEALQDSDVVIIPAGVPRKPGMTRDDLFKVTMPPVPPISSKILNVP